MIAAGDVRRAAEIADEAMWQAWADYSVGLAASEDRITERFAVRLQDAALEFFSGHGHVLQVRPLQASAGNRRRSEESQYGADFVVTLSIDTAQQQHCSGWIGQAKVDDKASWPDLQDQCRQMDDVLPGLGWAVLYSRSTTVIPALEIASLTAPRFATSLRRTSWRQHFEDFFTGRVGDKRACALLRTGFVEARQRRYGIGELLPNGAVVIDMYYGLEDRVGHWAETRSERLRGLPTSDPGSANG